MNASPLGQKEGWGSAGPPAAVQVKMALLSKQTHVSLSVHLGHKNRLQEHRGRGHSYLWWVNGPPLHGNKGEEVKEKMTVGSSSSIKRRSGDM